MQSDSQDEQTRSSGGSDDVVPGPTGDPEALSPANQEPRYPVPPPPDGVAPQRTDPPPPAFTPPPPPDHSVAAAHSWDGDASPAPDSSAATGQSSEAASTAPDQTTSESVAPLAPAAGTTDSDAPSAPSQTQAAAAPPAQLDHMAGICPYLQSEDGSYQAIKPDEGHRCGAQEPLGTLPLAFQERYCLTDRYARCEMFKYAQEASGAAPAGSAPVAAASTQPVSSTSGGDSRRPALIVAAGMGGIVILVVVMLLLFGGDDNSEGGGQAGSSASAEPVATEASEATPEPTPERVATPEPAVTQTPDADSAPDTELPGGTATIPIRYQVQEAEQLVRIAETFGVSRRRILRANPGMEDLTPYVQAGDEIIVPASSNMTIEELEAVPGYLGLVEP